MHFAKTYAAVLQTLPEDLQDNAIQYRHLKRLIKDIVRELEGLGLGPDVLSAITHGSDTEGSGSGSGTGTGGTSSPGSGKGHPPVKVVYEVVGEGDHIQPRLRLWVDDSNRFEEVLAEHEQGQSTIEPTTASSSSVTIPPANPSLETHSSVVMGASMNLRAQPPDCDPPSPWSTTSLKLGGGRGSPPGLHEVVVPLTSDTAFFRVLFTALQALSAHLAIVEKNFRKSLEEIARIISSTAHPLSAVSSSFHPRTLSGEPVGGSSSTSLIHSRKRALRHSDLYAWRQIFALYMDMEVFESGAEHDRGARSVEESESRLQKFTQRVGELRLSDRSRMHSAEGRTALEMFLELNLVILNLKKFQQANAEAIRKILKKHSKRTALPLPIVLPDLNPSAPSQALSIPLTSTSLASNANERATSNPYTDLLTLLPGAATSFPRLLMQALGETLLPIIPSVDDYACLICSDLAFRPIRLACGHLFCVRCLTKMQKRKQEACPVCRAPSVLVANRSNVDLALQNFMEDWFPLESQEKLQSNLREVSQEQVEELGLEEAKCIIS